MEDETDLPDLANLDLDDSADDFFKMESKPNSNVKTILIILIIIAEVFFVLLIILVFIRRRH
jgi:hypothetical protein